MRDFNLAIKEREFIVLVGPSGCGKSTTLRMIAGLEEISSGKISIGGKLMNKVAPKDRDIAMVFQSYALYPHMTVFENMAFALKMRKLPKATIADKVRRAADVLGIGSEMHKRPRQLSGGQRKRVALGRAIVREPQCFLFDEPLSNLDAKLRVEMRAEIKRLHLTLGSTTVYVTHDQEEAITLGDRVVVMNDGVVQQCASALDIYHHPANRFVAGFLGTPPMNFFEGRLIENSVPDPSSKKSRPLFSIKGPVRCLCRRARRRRCAPASRTIPTSCWAYARKRWRPRRPRASRRRTPSCR